ncbi:MAG: trypsin-like peptidase domain-containing protein [Phycisphaerae bacterium]|jgi:hypothetical protein
MARSPKPLARLLLVGSMLTLAAAPRAAAEDAADFAALLREKSPALVTIKFVLNVKMGGMMSSMGESENEQEITGVLIEPDGLVLCSNTQLSGMAGMMRRMLGSMGEISATPTDLKLLIGDDTEGAEAELVARDTDLDLAWIRLKSPPPSPLRCVNLADSKDAALGMPVYALKRMGKYFDRVVVLSEARVAGMTHKPRNLMVPSSALGAMGLPVYAADGKVVGVSVLQMPEPEGGDGNPMRMLSSLGSMEEMMTGMILPAQEVAKATRRAKESAENRGSAPAGDSATREPESDKPAASGPAKP